jgi:hypothetical protein
MLVPVRGERPLQLMVLEDLAAPVASMLQMPTERDAELARLQQDTGSVLETAIRPDYSDTLPRRKQAKECPRAFVPSKGFAGCYGQTTLEH